MQIIHSKTLLPASDVGLNRVTALCWSQNNMKMAVVSSDRVVHIFDGEGERRDKFSTKPAPKGIKNYVVTGVAFSPDNTKLAVAQSDSIVYVYKLGLEIGKDKKTICNKFQMTSPITCLVWPHAQEHEMVFGLAEGKVKMGHEKTNKSTTLYSTESYVVSLAHNIEGNAIISGHQDGSIYRFYFGDGARGPTYNKIAQHSCSPSALAWGINIAAAGNDGRITFYDDNGGLVKNYEYTNDTKVKEFGCASANGSGDAIIMGNFNKFFTFTYNIKTSSWDESNCKNIQNMLSVTSIAWKPDGSRVCLGGACGVVDSYDACVRRYKYKSLFEFTFVSQSRVIITTLSSGNRVVVKSEYGEEISKVNIFKERFIIAHTRESLIVGDIVSRKVSEIPWHSGGSEKFFFDNPSICMVFESGELSLIEYGSNEILGSCRTEHVSSHLLSVRINERPPAIAPEDLLFGAPPSRMNNKKMAYLLDLQTIRVLDLDSGITVATISHESRIDWIELNGRNSMLLFRDKRRQLMLFDLQKQIKTTLLNYCNYVQWVPDSDVVVAQNRGNLCVWYNINAPDKVSNFPIKGDIEEIERELGRTAVLVDEGKSTASYLLDESLIAFGTAVDDRDYQKAQDLLESLEVTAETEAMWSQLNKIAIATGNLYIAQRCSAALGDISTSRYLCKVNKIAQKAASKTGGDGYDNWLVRAKLAQVRGDTRSAENIYVEQGHSDEAIEMHQTMRRWDEAIIVAENSRHPEVNEMKKNYYQYLLSSGQEDVAAGLKEQAGDTSTAIELYLKAGLPSKAAAIVTRSPSKYSHDVLEKIAAAFISANMFSNAGEFFEKTDQLPRALDSYIKGNDYKKAVELARRNFPGQVVRLEEQFGDYLVSQKRVNEAIAHFIEAGVNRKAIEASLNSRQWSKAQELVEDTLRNLEHARPYYRQIAAHYHECKMYEKAEKLYVKAGLPQEAVEMYTNAGRFESAHAIARSYMSEREVTGMYVSEAQKQEALGKLKQAEKLYLTIHEPDLAINMYKKAKKYDNMIALVAKYREDLLTETHTHLAQELEMEGNLKVAEHHYCEAKDWQSAVNMYRANDMWDEAIRVAKFHGGLEASKRVAVSWARSLGGEAGNKLLQKLGLIEQAIEWAIAANNFDHAFELARKNMKSLLPDVHLKHALHLEDKALYKEAEDEFVKANKPKEAIEMYSHLGDWVNAIRVAETYDPSCVPDVLVLQARNALETKDYTRAESLFINAKKPELAIKAYVDAKMWNEAIRIAKVHLPHKLHEVNLERQRSAVGGGGTKDDYVTAAKAWEEDGEWGHAIDSYMNITKEILNDYVELEKIWMHAIEIAASNCKDRYVSIVEEVSSRLVSIKKHEAAADLFKDIGLYDQAIDCYIAGNAWTKARNIAETYAPNSRGRVNKAYQSHLVEKKDADELVETGNIEMALDMFAQRGEWEKCLNAAANANSGIAPKYALMFARDAFSKGKNEEALAALAKYGAPPVSLELPFYQDLVMALFKRTKDAEEKGGKKVSSDLREFLYKLVFSLKAGSESKHPMIPDFEKLLLIAHYYVLRKTCQEKGLKDLYAKITISLVRYANVINADKLFFQAAMACKDAGWLGMAFVMLNRYLDLTEAIEDGHMDMIDNSDFIGTDIPPPHDYKMPKESNQFVNEKERDEVREWLLQLSLDNKVTHALRTRACSSCSAEVYEASLVCHNCNDKKQACICSGYPLTASSTVSCTGCSSKFIKEHWNTYLGATRSCPWCGILSNPSY